MGDIFIWQGERKLLPLDDSRASYHLHCLHGQGCLRIMSQAWVQYLVPHDTVALSGHEVATLSAEQDMKLRLFKDPDTKNRYL